MLIGIPTHQCPFILCTYLEGALTREDPTSALARAKALGAASLMAWQLSDYAGAKEAAEEGLRLSKEAGIEDSRTPFFPGGSPQLSS